MATYVLVPGAWLGAWAWRPVTAELRAAGHTVHPVTLTGLADRAHLGGPAVDLETHAADLTTLIEAEELSQAILVAHSYAGLPAALAADRIGSRLSHVAYVDSAPLGEGMTMFDLTGPAAEQEIRAAVAAGDGWGIPYPDLEGQTQPTTGLTEAHRVELRRRATPHPMGSYAQPVHYTRADPGAPQQVEIACEQFQGLLDSGNPGVGFIDDSWTRLDLDTGHWPMFSRPRELAAVLAGLAG